MKARTDFRINGKLYPKDSSFRWYMIYPLFLVHMLAFGLSGFFMAYSDNEPELSFLYTFLLYQMVLDITGARGNPQKRRFVEAFYVTSSLLVYGMVYLKEH